MTKRQMNSTYLRLRRESVRLRKVYWKLVDDYLQCYGKTPWAIDGFDWVFFGKGRKIKIKTLKYNNDFYKMRIKKMQMELL